MLHTHTSNSVDTPSTAQNYRAPKAKRKPRPGPRPRPRP